MKQSLLHSPRLTLALCVLSMPMPMLNEDDGPPLAKSDDMKANSPDVQVRRAGRRPPIRPRYRQSTPQPLHEYGLIVGHTRHPEVGGPQRAQDHRIVGLN